MSGRGDPCPPGSSAQSKDHSAERLRWVTGVQIVSHSLCHAEKLSCRKRFDDKPDSQRRRVEHLRQILVVVLFARMVHDVRRYVSLQQVQIDAAGTKIGPNALLAEPQDMQGAGHADGIVLEKPALVEEPNA